MQPLDSDALIAASVTPKPIAQIGARLGLTGDDLIPYGKDKAKVDLSVLDRPRARPGQGRLILVSAITPTPAGEGKTTTSIGLAQALDRLGESVCLALREPSLGPVMGMKGGATGGGRSQLTPADSINLHFTGDFHAITAAHNLLAAVIDNHLQQGNALSIDPRRVVWPRVLDVNDRSLRQVIIGLGGTANGTPRESSFDITAASEVMAMLCLASGVEDLRVRIDRTLVAWTLDGQPVRAGQLGVTGAMLALLRDAMNPNLVQTLEGAPALVHGGPFANIAHGCNSVLATKMALHLADWCITEAGFGFDLGAEKFFDIKCQGAGLDTAAVVLVATIRALKMHGGTRLEQLGEPDAAAVQRGLPNLAKHVESVLGFGEPVIVALNRFAADTDTEIAEVAAYCASVGVPFALSEHHTRGGEGAEALARAVLAHAEKTPRPFTPTYTWDQPIPDKIRAVATKVYGARGVVFTKEAERDLRELNKHGFGGLPVCIAKTQNSLSDDPKRRGRPTDFDVTVRRLLVNAGAGFVVVITGEIMRMPGLPAHPHAEHIDVVHGKITGIR